MSTTRWIIETPCEHKAMAEHWMTKDGRPPKGFVTSIGRPDEMCPGGSRTVVDPDNLPPEAIQRAAKAIHAESQGRRYAFETMGIRIQNKWRREAEVAVRAFLSDPEPGDQP